MPAGSFGYISGNSREMLQFTIGHCFREIHCRPAKTLFPVKKSGACCSFVAVTTDARVLRAYSEIADKPLNHCGFNEVDVTSIIIKRMPRSSRTIEEQYLHLDY
jgi:hypothetical protein